MKKVSKSGLVIFTVASEHYLIYLERFLASANLFFPNAIIHVALINVDKLQVQYLRSLYNNLEIEHHDIEFNNIETLKGYCGNLYSRMFPILLAQYDCPVIYMDSDSLFLKNADELYEYSKLYDLSCEINLKHPSIVLSKRKIKKIPKGPFGTPFFGVMNSAIIITNNSVKAKEYFQYNSKLIKKHPYVWFADQESLYLTYKKFQNKISFHPLERKFCSVFNTSDTIIWRAKGKTRENNEYMLIGRKYINIVRNRANKVLDETGLYKDPFKNKDKKYSLTYKMYLRLKKTLKFFFKGRID